MPDLPALIVNQWLPEWDSVRFSTEPPRRKPSPKFYLLAMSAFDLKLLSGIYRRDGTKHPTEDLGIQRRHMPDRSREIFRYLHNGFPLSRLSTSRLVDEAERAELRMPGWIPTAIIANVLDAKDKRGPAHQTSVPKKDLITVSTEQRNGLTTIHVPDHCLAEDWRHTIPPIEIIDGQHRLWALEEDTDDDLWSGPAKERLRRLQIPVVAFHGLDITWQAYLFYTINQLPKRIDKSLVFDLYPLLRTEEWLLRFEGPEVYRETRAQDLTILLWSNTESPWHQRILRLGGRERGKVTQASFIRSLMASFIKRSDVESDKRVGGLFGAPKGTHQTQLEWTREQQAAFLIMTWQAVRTAIAETKSPWAAYLRNLGDDDETSEGADPAFDGPNTLLASDQGCRCILFVMNDFFWVEQLEETIDLRTFGWERKSKHDDDEAVSHALAALEKSQPDACKLAKRISQSLATFDWRLSSSLSTKDPAFDRQSTYRGSSGYRSLRRNVLEHLQESGDKQLVRIATSLVERLGIADTSEDEE